MVENLTDIQTDGEYKCILKILRLSETVWTDLMEQFGSLKGTFDTWLKIKTKIVSAWALF